MCVGRYVRPQISRAKRGLNEGRQAETTPIDGSAADQMAAGTKFQVRSPS